MCAASPGSRVARSHQSGVVVNVVGEKDARHALTTLLNVIKSSFGPTGRLKAVHNNSGGHVTLTSSANRLIPVLSLSNPILKLIIPAVERHEQLHQDGGLFCGLLALEIITTSLAFDIHKRLMIEIYELLAKDCVEYLTREYCECTEVFDIMSFQDLLSLVRSIIGSKPGCCLYGGDLEHMCVLVSEAFLKTLDTTQLTSPTHQGTILYISVEGLLPHESHIVEGILFEVPQIPTYLSKPLAIKCVDRGANAGMVKVALFNVSLAGDSTDFLDADYETECEVKVEDAVVHQMLVCAEALVRDEVGVVMCQRVVHPALKKYLQKHGVLVLDRLGNRYIYSAQQITGCQVLSTFLQEPCKETYGWLGSVNHQVLQGRSYLRLARPGSTVVTLVLTHQSEEALEELKVVCMSCQYVLQSALRMPKVLAGGGCWQTHLAHHCRTQARTLSKSWSSSLECSPTQLTVIVDNMAACLERTALALGEGVSHMTDSANHHHWQSLIPVDGATRCEIMCSCGKLAGLEADIQFEFLGKNSRSTADVEIKDRDTCPKPRLVGNMTSRIVDPFVAYLSAFKTAVATSCMVLGIHNYIHYTN